MMRPLKSEKGFALLVTLVVTALLVAVVVEMAHQVYVDISISRGFRDGQQASLYADSGISGGQKLLQTVLSDQGYSSLSDKWALPLRLDDESGSIEVSIVEENGKINLNDLVQPNGELEPFTAAALKRLGRQLQVPEQVWSALADWMDSDDMPRPDGAETSFYRNQKPPYACRNNKLSSLAELSLVKGFTAEMIERIKPFVSVSFSQNGMQQSPININAAPKEVLAALDDSIDTRMAERILEERRLAPFKTRGELSRIPGGDVLSQKLASKITVKGMLFRIISVARVKESGRTVETLVRIVSDIPETLTWQEY